MRLSEKDTVERFKARQGLISKIQNLFTGGYATKEDIREKDKQLRDLYYEDLRELRHRWEKAYMDALDAGRSELGRPFKGAIQTLDRVIAQIQRADYGYAGLMDRKGHIREQELAGTFDFDREFEGELDRLRQSAEKVFADVKSKLWVVVRDDMDAVNGDLQGVEGKWREREKRFRSVEV